MKRRNSSNTHNNPSSIHYIKEENNTSNNLFNRTVKKSRLNIKRKQSVYQIHNEEFGSNEENEDEYEEGEHEDSYTTEQYNKRISNGGIAQKPVFIALEEMIQQNSPLIVITSAIAEAEHDYENNLHKKITPIETPLSLSQSPTIKDEPDEECNDTITLKKEITILSSPPKETIALTQQGVPFYNQGNRKSFDKIEPKVKPYPYQEEAVQFLIDRESDKDNIGCKGLMLCDDMGLGKTLETLIFIFRDIQRLYRLTGKRFNGVTLIVMPKIVIETWTKEIANSFPPNTFHYIKLIGDKSSIPDNLYIDSCVDIIFTTYDVVKLAYKSLYGGLKKKNNNTNKEEDEDEEEYEDEEEDDEDDEYNSDISSNEEEEEEEEEDDECIRYRYRLLFEISYRRVITDEAQQMVNRNTLVFLAMNKLKAVSKWMITGTPVQNSYSNIYACLEFIEIPPEKIGISWNGILLNNNNNDNNISNISIKDTEILKKILETVMLRRLKQDIMLKYNNNGNGNNDDTTNNTTNAPFGLNKIDKKIEFIDFDTEQERILYLLYAEYGLDLMLDYKKNKAFNEEYNDLHIDHKIANDYEEDDNDNKISSTQRRGRRRIQKRKNDNNKDKRRNKKRKIDSEKNMNITSIIQYMRQCCIDFRIIRKHILPNGMLTMNNDKFMKPQDKLILKPTTFNEKLFYNESCEFKHIDKDNESLEYKAFILNNPVTFNYKSSKSNVKYKWNPYKNDNPLVDLDNDEFSRTLYKIIYSYISDIRAKTKKDPTLNDIKHQICNTLKVSQEEKDNNRRDILYKQVTYIYIHILSRTLPLYATKPKRMLRYIQEEIDDPTDKVIIFSDSVCFLKLMVGYLADHSIHSCLVTGEKAKHGENENQLNRFENDLNIRVLLISIKVGNVGLNIPCANHILFGAKWWNPCVELQGECRAQRIGQKKEVHIRYFVIKDTMEEYVLNLSEYKNNISRNLIENSTSFRVNSNIDELLENIDCSSSSKDTKDEINRLPPTRLFDFKIDTHREKRLYNKNFNLRERSNQ